MPYFEEQVARAGKAASPAIRKQVIALAERILATWEGGDEHFYKAADASRAEMLDLLVKLKEPAFLKRFIAGIVTDKYDGTENESLPAALDLLDSETAGEVLCGLAGSNMAASHKACVDLLQRMLHRASRSPAWMEALHDFAEVMVTGIAEIGGSSFEYRAWNFRSKLEVDSILIVDLLDALAQLEATPLRKQSAINIAGLPAVFDPGKIVVPALVALHQTHGEAVGVDAAFLILWKHAADFLLTRSEYPHEPPKDWSLHVQIRGRGKEIGELQAFANDPLNQVHRFTAIEGVRSNLEQTITGQRLDMDCVTERKGRPYTLVCTKNRRTYLDLCSQRRTDVASLTVLLQLLDPAPKECRALWARINAAIQRPEK
jgi:hypothetical protein